jgi:hypothetical protein
MASNSSIDLDVCSGGFILVPDGSVGDWLLGLTSDCFGADVHLSRELVLPAAFGVDHRSLVPLDFVLASVLSVLMGGMG